MHPPSTFRLIGSPPCQVQAGTYIIYLAPLFYIHLNASDSSETREEPLSYSMNEIYSRLLRQPRPARRNVEAHEVFPSGKIEGLKSGPQTLFPRHAILVGRHFAAYQRGAI
jgi:hypothetical protein